MNSIELLLIDLVQMAEAPLYSAYRWVDRRFAGRLPMGSFLAVLDGLITRDAIRMWSVDLNSGDRTELFEVPRDLATRYGEVPDLDEQYDPLGLSLTVGSTAGPRGEPEWTLDLDARQETFELHAVESEATRALHDVERLFPDLRFSPLRTDVSGADGVVITGRATPESGAHDC